MSVHSDYRLMRAVWTKLRNKGTSSPSFLNFGKFIKSASEQDLPERQMPYLRSRVAALCCLRRKV